MRLTAGILFLFIISIFQSCKKEKETVPYAEVDITLNLNNAKYYELNTIGGYIYLTAQYPSKGIIVYRKSFEEYLAYERSCTYDPEGSCCAVDVEDDGVYAIDSCCNSRFLLLDGSPYEDGPASMPLKQYRTNADGSYLHIYN